MYIYVDRRISLASVGLGLSLVWVRHAHKSKARKEFANRVRTFSLAPCKLLHPSI